MCMCEQREAPSRRSPDVPRPTALIPHRRCRYEEEREKYAGDEERIKSAMNTVKQEFLDRKHEVDECKMRKARLTREFKAAIEGIQDNKKRLNSDLEE